MTGIPEERERSASTTSSGGGAGSGPEMNGGCSARSPARARAARSTVGSNVNGSSGTSLPGMTLRVSKGCNGCLTTIVSRTGAARGPVEGVEQFGQRHRGRALLAGVLVGAGVGDDQLLGGRADGVEQQLPVLGADVALTGHRVAGQHVVAVDHAEPREHAVVEADQADHPVRHRPHRHHRADRQRSGAEVGAGRASGQVALQQRADVGQPHRRIRPWAGAAQHVGELALQLAGLPRVVVVDPGQQLDTVLQARRATRAAAVCPVSDSTTCCSRSTYSASLPASSTRLLLTSSSGRVVSSQACESSDIATPASTRSMPKRQVFWMKSTPNGCAMLAVETPADVRFPHPAGDVLEVVVAELEPGPYRRGGARLSTSLAVARPPASVSNCDATPSSGLV